MLRMCRHIDHELRLRSKVRWTEKKSNRKKVTEIKSQKSHRKKSHRKKKSHKNKRLKENTYNLYINEVGYIVHV